ncbi:MAG: sensor domain-containing diguanylate cyclase [Deltaproteobacteria bacterium]|nr:sensor domain-containing diguanylate cyclase [Deltaproteobacteria bacterium]
MPLQNDDATKAGMKAMLDQLERQQKMIGELQVLLQTSEDNAANLDNRVFQMRTLLQSGKGFSQMHDLQSLLDAFMAVCRERYGAINSTVLLLDDLDPKRILYRVRGYFGVDAHFVDSSGVEEELYMFKLPHDRGLLWQLIHQGDVFAVRDMRRLPRFETAFKKWNLGILHSDIWVPLIRGADVLGILTLGECADGSQIPESDYTFLEEIAAVAATNIDSTLKYEKNNRILRNLQTLYDVNQQLINVNDYKHLVKETLSTAVKALHAQKANLMLLNKDTNRLEIKVVYGDIPASTVEAINEGNLETRSFEIGEGVAGKTALTRKPIRINDRLEIEQVGRYPVYCIMSVPIVYGNNVEGVITLTNKVRQGTNDLELDPLGRFGVDDEQLLVSLADNAATNLNKTRMYNASITDRLTNLYNARHFESRLSELRESARVAQTNFSLAIVDIDFFKKFNDTHGHMAGDFVLEKTAALFRDAVRQGSDDICFRYGGEEFCMLLPNTTALETAEQMDLFRKSVENALYPWEGKELYCTVSVGVAEFAGLDENLSIFETADKSLYASKEGGRNRVSCYSNGEILPF